MQKSDAPLSRLQPSRLTLGRTISEVDILQMRSLVLQKTDRQKSESEAPSTQQADPLNRFLPEPTCTDDCRDCQREQGEQINASGSVEWTVIAYHMKQPKWVFDGRGIVDMVEMEKLGFRVEVIGKVGLRSRLNGKYNILH